MINANEARTMVKAYNEKIECNRRNEATEIVERADSNITGAATKGLNCTTIGYGCTHDDEVKKIVCEMLMEAGYKVTHKGGYVLIEW